MRDNLLCLDNYGIKNILFSPIRGFNAQWCPNEGGGVATTSFSVCNLTYVYVFVSLYLCKGIICICICAFYLCSMVP